MTTAQSILTKLNLTDVNYGACGDDWINDRDGSELASLNPTTNEAIAHVVQATRATYDVVVHNAQNTFLDWRNRPAPNAAS